MKKTRTLAPGIPPGMVPRWLVRLAAALLAVSALLSCLPTDNRTAGSSTEAGNAGGKLSLSDGSPAAGVSVALVARSYLPDTLSKTAGNKPGTYYRTRTGADGRFTVEGMVPGKYRLLAVGGGGGVMADTVVVESGPDTSWVDETLKPLGAIRGVAKLVGSETKVNLWVRPKATVKDPLIADSIGGFKLDSLPEGEYELVPECFSCAPAAQPYAVRVKAGHATVMVDTMKLYPQYFQGFPDSGLFKVRSTTLPIDMGGKVGHPDQFDVLPRSAAWTWNGRPMVGQDIFSKGRLSGTTVRIDSTFFTESDEGTLRLTLHFTDTVLVRTWGVQVDRSTWVWPLQVVEVDSVQRVPSPGTHLMMRFRVARTRAVMPADVAFWGLDSRVTEPDPSGLPTWLELGVSQAESAILAGQGGASPLTFILVPDARYGGRVFRPRRDERLEDFGNIRFLEKARLGFFEAGVPSMLPGLLVLDRVRANRVFQRYAIDSSGKVRELIGPLGPTGPDQPMAEPPLFFFRSGDAGAGYAWDKPSRDAAKALAVTREGRAQRLDKDGRVADLPAAELASLDSLLGALSQDPPGLPDTATLAPAGTLDYLWYRGRGLLRGRIPGTSGDSLLQAVEAWMIRNGLDGGRPAFPLGTATWKFQAFTFDPALRYTGDTLELDLEEGLKGTLVRESLSSGSPGRLAGDTSVITYSLAQEGDTLQTYSGLVPVSSRIVGSLDGRQPLFQVNGLASVSTGFQDGLPILESGGDILAGRIEGNLVGWGRVLASPGVLLDGRGIKSGLQGIGYLYTVDGGLERAWRFGGRSGGTTGWIRL